MYFQTFDNSRQFADYILGPPAIYPFYGLFSTEWAASSSGGNSHYIEVSLLFKIEFLNLNNRLSY